MKISFAEKALKKLCERKYVLFTGNATTSLFLSLKSLNLKKGSRVMVSNNSCPHVPLSIYLAGLTPFFIDIDKNNFGMNVETLKKGINTKVKAIIAVHAYGNMCNIKEISKFCEKKRIPLIEDSALLLGVSANNKPIGSFGNISVLSFGKGKVIEAGDGGAIMTNDLQTFQKIKIFNDKLGFKKPSAKSQIDKMDHEHTEIYNNYYLKNKKNIIQKIYMSKALNKAKYLLYKFDRKLLRKIILNKKNINHIRKKRIENCRYLERKLKKIKSNFFDLKKINKNSIPWRYNIFFHKERDRNYVLQNLLNKKLKISSWHPRLDIFFEKKKNKTNYSTTDILDKSILNIWINNEINRSYLDKIVKNISLLRSRLMK